MKNFLLPVILFFSLSVSAQQNSNIDSLLREADASKPDTVRMQALYKIGKAFMSNNVTKAIEFLEKAKNIALKKDRRLLAANCYYSMGYCYRSKADFERSLYNYQQSEKYYVQLKDTFRLSNALMAIGNVYTDFKKPEKTTEYYNRAERMIIEMNDTLQLANIYGERGILYDQSGQYDSALKYTQKSYELEVLIGDSTYAYSSLSNLGLTYKHLRRHEEALKCFEAVLAYYNGKDITAFNKGIVYNNIGSTYAQMGVYDKALQAFNTSLEYGRQADIASVLMENYNNMSDMFGEMKDYKQQSEYLKKYYHLKDSLFSIESQNRVTQLEADYQLERKNAELAIQEAETGKQKNQRNIFIIIAAAFVVVLVLLSVFYKRIHSANKQLTEKNAQINEQKEQLQQLNQVKDRLFSIISHDLRNPLATLQSYLSLTADESMPAEKKELFRRQTMNMVSSTSDLLNNLLAWANVQVKKVQASITPVSISDCVQDAVHNINPQAQQKNIMLQQDLQAETALSDYNILSVALRNLITNAVKFSTPGSSIGISSVSQNGHLLLSVQDHGTGMKQEKVEEILRGDVSSSEGTAGEKGSGLGLFLVTELLKKVNAELLIESKEGEGSKFTIVMARV